MSDFLVPFGVFGAGGIFILLMVVGVGHWNSVADSKVQEMVLKGVEPNGSTMRHMGT